MPTTFRSAMVYHRSIQHVSQEAGSQVYKSLKYIADFIPDDTLAEDIELVIAYTPDVEWLAEQYRQGRPLGDAMAEALTRPEIFGPGKGSA